MTSRHREDFDRFWKHMPWQSKDETAIVLKGHLLAEDLLRSYCEEKLPRPHFILESRLQFTTVMNLTRSLSDADGETWTWTALERLNDLRNRLAHNLEPREYVTKRESFVSLVRRSHQATNIDDLFEHHNAPYEQVGAAIFFMFSSLSIYLRITSGERRMRLAEMLGME
jgi:hypothetical protein